MTVLDARAHHIQADIFICMGVSMAAKQSLQDLIHACVMCREAAGPWQVDPHL